MVGCFIDRSVGEALLNELADDVLVKKFWYCGVARALNTGELISWRYMGVVFMPALPFVKLELNDDQNGWFFFTKKSQNMFS